KRYPRHRKRCSFPTRRSSDLGDMLNLYNIKIDFKKDFVDILRSRLKLEGYDTSKINDKDICFSYFNLKKRLISTKVRKIKIANEDRKSTRLNSSHVSISYAVF